MRTKHLLLHLAIIILTANGCSNTPAFATDDITPNDTARIDWSAISSDITEILDGNLSCSESSLAIGFCRLDANEAPIKEAALLAGGCRGQPITYLSKFDENDGRSNYAVKVREVLQEVGAEILDVQTMTIEDQLRRFHDIDQRLRFFDVKDPKINPQLAWEGKWIAICAFSRYAASIVRPYIHSTNASELSKHEELLNSVWILVQHSDHDPSWQEEMANWFSESDQIEMQASSAFLTDRSAVARGRLQVYGTQLRCVDGTRVPFPVIDESNLNSRRAMVGLETIEERIRNFPRPCPPK